MTAEAPEAEGSAVTGLEDRSVETGEAASEGVLKIAAGEVLFEQSDDEEAEEPASTVAKGFAAEEKTAVEDEEACLPEDEYEERQTGDTPGETGKEVR